MRWVTQANTVFSNFILNMGEVDANILYYSYMTAVYDANNHVFIRFGSLGERTSSTGSGSYATIASFSNKAPPSPSPYATSDAFCNSYTGSSQQMLLSQVKNDKLMTLLSPVFKISNFTLESTHRKTVSIFGSFV